MPYLMQTIEHYLYTTKKDVFILQLKNQGDGIAYDRENQENINTEESQLQWFRDHNITFAKTGPLGLLCGWLGQYYVAFDGWDDPLLKSYSETFENEDGRSNDPDKYQMFCSYYENWVNNGDLANYEQYLIDREDPDFEW